MSAPGIIWRMRMKSFSASAMPSAVFRRRSNTIRKHAESFFGRGSCYDALDHPRKALEDYDAALNINNKNAELWYAKADALYNLGRLIRSAAGI